MCSASKSPLPQQQDDQIVQQPVAQFDYTSRSYVELLNSLRARIQQARTKASLSVNRELVLLYWEIGRMILAADDITVLIESSGPSALDSLAIFLNKQSVCSATNPLLPVNNNRNVPPERDVEPAMLSLAELCGSIQLPWRAMQPHNGLRNSARTPHVR